jgi:hypothetical protein
VERIVARVGSHPFKDVPAEERPRLVAGLVGFPHPGLARPEDLLAAAEAAVRSGAGVAGVAAA